METYDSIKKHLVRALEHVEVLNDTDVCLLDGEGLAEITKLVTIMNRRLKRLCDGKADNLNGVAYLQEGLMLGQRLLGQKETATSSFNENVRLGRALMGLVKK